MTGAPRPIALIGMSGVGKTRVASMLRREARYFHYSVDYRIGTRYLGEAIADEFKREAMKNPVLAEMLLYDSIYISSNITFENLAPLSAWLGKPGNPSKGGIPFAEYLRRQRLHREAEISALMDTALFVEKAKAIYGYDRFVCDVGGSICEIVDPDDPSDPVLAALSAACDIIVIDGGDAHAEALKARFAKSPKPMYYNEAFLTRIWADYLTLKGANENKVDPDDFIRWGFAQLIEWRGPRYRKIGEKWGKIIGAARVEKTNTPASFLELFSNE